MSPSVNSCLSSSLQFLQMDAEYDYSLVSSVDFDEMYGDLYKHKALPWEDPM